jgi:hypothetical protein
MARPSWRGRHRRDVIARGPHLAAMRTSGLILLIATARRR